MRKEKISKAVNDIQSRYIEEAEEYIAKRKKFSLRKVYIKSLAAAACICAVFTMILLSGGTNTIFSWGAGYKDIPEILPSSSINKYSFGEPSILRSVYRPDTGTLTYSYSNSTVTICDESGNEIISITAGSDGSRKVRKSFPANSQKCEYEYDADGYLVRDTVWGDTHYYVCEYDRSGRVTEIKLYALIGRNEYRLAAATKYTYEGDTCTKEQKLEDMPEDSLAKYYVDEYGLINKIHYIDSMYELCCDYNEYYSADGSMYMIINNALAGAYVNEQTEHMYNENGNNTESTTVHETDGYIHISKQFSSQYKVDLFTDKAGNIVPLYMYGGNRVNIFTHAHGINEYCEPEYDENGRIVKCTHEYGYVKSVCLFNENGQKIREYIYIYDICVGSAKYDYTETGRSAGIIYANKSGSESKEFIFDEAGRVCKYRYFTSENENSNFEAVLEMEFDESGNSYMKNWHMSSSENDMSLYCVEYKYDKSYDITGKILYYNEDTNGAYYTETYNEAGRKIFEKHYDSDAGFLFGKELVYNERGWLTRENIYDQNYVLQKYTEYTRGGAGEILDASLYTGDGERIKSEITDEYSISGAIGLRTETLWNGSIYLYNFDRNGNVCSINSKTDDGEYIYEFIQAENDEEFHEYEIYSEFSIEELINKYF